MSLENRYITASGSPDKPERMPDGGLFDWRGPKHFTRSELRFGVFWRTPGMDHAKFRTNYPTITEAISFAGEHSNWQPDHVYDFVRREVVHVFT